MQKWREQRAERQQLAPADRQKLMEQMRDRMWSQRTGTTASS